MKGISSHKQDSWFAQCCLTRLYTLKPELGKEVESDPELADFIWNGSDALLPMNQTIEHINKARFDYIKSIFGGMCPAAKHCYVVAYRNVVPKCVTWWYQIAPHRRSLVIESHHY